MARSKSSHLWLQEHFSDEYVKRSWKDGFRSRAAYKLLEIQQKDRILKKGQTVVDLGAAPGGWSHDKARLRNMPYIFPFQANVSVHRNHPAKAAGLMISAHLP